MIAEQFPPIDIECLIKTAVDLWHGAELSTRQRDVLARADAAMEADHAGQRPTSPAASAVLESQPADRVWILWHSTGVVADAGLSAHRSEDAALAELAQHARTSWPGGEDGVPEQPPADDRQAVDLYFGPEGERDGDTYLLREVAIGPRRPTRLLPLGLRFPDAAGCAQANREAIFHPMTEDDTLPALETAGVLVFAYLDAAEKAVRVSVHLDTTDERLIRADATVPLRVMVGDAVVFDDSGHTGPTWNLLDELLQAADHRQSLAIEEAALAAGILWRCPTCRW
ncbi:hypothetical protein, partial [Nonomuraea sp. NPDC049784]|uniref:hypothetical protein n=1 Tax=Nonomuraea sp. NPDC049784 TaxID=3154361 RepID=UPI0033F65BF1